MANCYFVCLAIRGRKNVLDEIQKTFQQEIDEGQTLAEYYTMGKTLRRMGYDPDKMDWRSYTDTLDRVDDEKLYLYYTGAWGPHPQVIIAIREKWQVEIGWAGIDEFGQYPVTTCADDEGKYRLDDLEKGCEPFCDYPEWLSEEEALKVINDYYGTDCKTLEDAGDIENLCLSDPMDLYREDENDVNAVKAAKLEG